MVTTSEAGTTEVAGLFVLPTTRANATQIRYDRPATVLARLAGSQATYRLRVQKQPGTAALPLDLTITYPADWTVQSASAPAQAGTPGEAHLLLRMETDLNVEVVFHTP